MSPVDAIVKYPFGHGLSYSKFEYSGFQVNSDRVSATGSVAVSLLVENTGTYLSSDVVQVYFEDPVASVARPVRQLVDFKKVSLAAGDQIQVSFEISAEQFAYIGADYKRIVDAGQIKILVGKSRDNILWETDIEVLETALV
jgi:hypothetical protein